MAIWLTSDWHLFHRRNFIYSPRGFYDVEEMNWQILTRYNSKIKPEDTVYVLGDCAVGGPITDEILDFMSQFNGHKYLAIGNHDGNRKIERMAAAGIFEDIAFAYRFVYKKKELYLSHYPTIVANFDDPKPVYNFFGHTHQSNNRFKYYNNMYHVGVDSHNCYPVLLDDALEEIREWK